MIFIQFEIRILPCLILIHKEKAKKLSSTLRPYFLGSQTMDQNIFNHITSKPFFLFPFHNIFLRSI